MLLANDLYKFAICMHFIYTQKKGEQGRKEEEEGGFALSIDLQ